MPKVVRELLPKLWCENRNKSYNCKWITLLRMNYRAFLEFLK